MKVRTPTRNSALALSVAVGAAGYGLAEVVDDFPSSPVRDVLLLGYPLVVGLVLGLTGAGIWAVLGAWLGILGAMALGIFVGPYQAPSQGDRTLAAFWLAAIPVMVAVGLGLGHAIGWVLRRPTRPR